MGDQSFVNSSYTEIYKVPQNTRKSSTKIELVHVFPEGDPSRERKVYRMIHDQNKTSLASSTFFDAFNVSGP